MMLFCLSVSTPNTRPSLTTAGIAAGVESDKKPLFSSFPFSSTTHGLKKIASVTCSPTQHNAVAQHLHHISCEEYCAHSSMETKQQNSSRKVFFSYHLRTFPTAATNSQTYGYLIRESECNMDKELHFSVQSVQEKQEILASYVNQLLV